MTARKVKATTPAQAKGLLASIGQHFGAEKRIDWTPAEKVTVYKTYLSEIEVDGNKRGALQRAIAALPADRQRSTAANAYTIIGNLETFAKKHSRLFKTTKIITGKIELSSSVNAFAARIRNCLIANDVHTVADLVQRTEAELMKFPNMGVKSVREVKEILARNGLKLTAFKLVPMPPAAPLTTPAPVAVVAAPAVTPDLVPRALVEELLAKLIKDADDRQVASLELMLDQLDIKFKQLTAVLTNELDLRFKVLYDRIDTLKPKPKKQTVLLIGGLDAQRGQIQSRFPWLDIDSTDGRNLKALADKGSYDLVIFWSTFSSHSIEDVLKNKYGADFITISPGKGLSTIIDTIARKLPKP